MTTEPAKPAGRAGLPPADESTNTLRAWGLTVGQAVEVDLLVAGIKWVGGPVEPTRVEGKVVSATDNALVIETDQAARVRVAWQAVAIIRDRITHPGL